MSIRSPARQAATQLHGASPARPGSRAGSPGGLVAIRSLVERLCRWRKPSAAAARMPHSGLDIPRLPEGERIYAIGDVHGRADLLLRTFAGIADHLSRHPVERHTVVLLGDYVDRGPRSRDVIEAILDYGRRSTIVALAGNHEALLLDFLNTPQSYPLWAKLGAAETLMSYGVAPPQTHAPEHLHALAETFRNALPPLHLAFLKGLSIAFSHEGFLFVHAGVRPNVPLDRQVAADLLWIRDDFLEHRGDFGAMIVHGHSRVAQPDIRPNRINIDTGAYVSNRLTCLVLDANGLSFL